MLNCQLILRYFVASFKKDEKKTVRWTIRHLFLANIAAIVVMAVIVANDIRLLPQQPPIAQGATPNITQQKPVGTPITEITGIPKINLAKAITTAFPSPTPQTSNSQTHQNATVLPPTQASDSQAYLLGLINSERAKVGAPALRLDGALSNCALNHSKAIADKGSLFHDLQNDVCDGSRSKGENVGTSSEQSNAGIDMVQNMMVAEKGRATPNHYSIMIDPTYTHIGIGIYLTGSGIWITEDFGG